MKTILFLRVQMSPFRRAEFISSTSLQVICGRRLQLHALQLAAKTNSTREISGLSNIEIGQPMFEFLYKVKVVKKFIK